MGGPMTSNKNVYALLVGIDRYPPPTPSLNGCRNDIAAIEQLLTARVNADGDTLHVLPLLDEQATRSAVIGGFRNHLGKAGNDDVALFYYSGHGSQEPAPEQWWDVEPDHLDETLVLYDSREPGQWDLADKELAALLNEFAEKRPHVLVVLDCCHSGSGTRAAVEDGLAERRAPTDGRERPISSFLFAANDAQALTKPANERATLGDSGWALPRARHVLLSGCRSNETSKEIRHDGTSRGALSAALGQALSSSGTGLTYRDVHRQVNAIIRTTVRNQHPQLETSSSADLDLPFLGGTVTALPAHFVMTHQAGQWTMDGGTMHGIAAPVGDESTRLQVRDENDVSVATATVTSVRAGEAKVTVVSGDLDETRNYRAIVTSTPLPPLRVRIAGDETAAASLRTALKERNKAGPLLVAEAGQDDAAKVVVMGTESGYQITRPGGERPMSPRADTAEQAVQILEHIAGWNRVSTLTNSATRLRADSVTVSVVPEPGPPGDPWDVDGAYRFTYVAEHGQSRPRKYTVKVTNNAGKPLWVALVDLTDTYGIYADALSEGAAELGDNQSLPIRLSTEVPDGLWEQGVTEVTDLLKIICSTEEFDPRTLEQGDLDITAELRPSGVRAAPKSTLDRLLQRIGTRRARPEGGDGEATADWFARDVQVVSVRPREGVAVAEGASVEVAAGVRLASHPSLRATVRLSSAPDATRDLQVAPAPEALRDTAPFGLVATRGGETEADSVVVEVAAEDISEVNADQPLVLVLDRGLENDEHVLPFAWDGEYYIPLGFARRTETGSEVVLQRLSAPISTERSLTGSVRILFRKLVGKRVGLPYEYPLLRMATASDDGSIAFEKDIDRIAATVGQATAVVLYVHGIIGDSEGMARSSRVSGKATPIGPAYSVILTFDYENLDTSIEENAASLAHGLKAIGLAAGHGKRFDIVAHSMGGLISRHMIEFVGGVEVSRLITLGTPNGGSPWPTVQKWATVGVAFAVNSLTAVVWPVQVLGTLLAAIEKVDTALDEMESTSVFLGQLARGPDPGVPYHVIVGDRSLVAGANAEGLLARLSPRRIASDLVDVAFFNQPNDLAVSVASAQSIPTGRKPAAQFYVLASDHVSFFVREASLAEMAEILLD